MKVLTTLTARRFLAGVLVAAAGMLFPGESKTRWSAVRFVPDADMLRSGELLVQAQGYLAKDTSDALMVNPVGMVRFGIVEWVNVEAGYADGFTMGFKARILGETRSWMPSLALGGTNLFHHREAALFGVEDADSIANEFYLVAGKSVDAIKIRFHLGIQSVPSLAAERFNPFFAIEKYFGHGLYATVEGFRRDEHFHMALFASWRLLKDRLEINAGAVGLRNMFFNSSNEFEVSLSPPSSNAFVKPGVSFGLAYHGRFGLGRKGGFISIEDRLAHQEATIESLRQKIDLLQSRVDTTRTTIDSVHQSIGIITDSLTASTDKLKSLILDRLITIQSLYEAEPFEPDRVRQLTRELVSFRDQAIPVLRELINDAGLNRAVRRHAIQITGEIGNRAAADALIDLIARTGDPDEKVECLIALGRMKETRMMYLMEQLASDPHDAVALTAQDVLARLSAETGARLSENYQPRPISLIDESKPVAEKKIVTREESDKTAPAAPVPLTPDTATDEWTEETIPAPAQGVPSLSVSVPETQEENPAPATAALTDEAVSPQEATPPVTVPSSAGQTGEQKRTGRRDKKADASAPPARQERGRGGRRNDGRTQPGSTAGDNANEW